MSGNDERVRSEEGRHVDRSVVEIFNHVGRTCVIRRMYFGTTPEEKGWLFHNGYVSVLWTNHGICYSEDRVWRNVNSEGLTYAGAIRHPNISVALWFLGFDSAHAWNFEEPESQTYYSVRGRTIELAEELVRLNI